MIPEDFKGAAVRFHSDEPVIAAANRLGVPADFMLAVAEVESRGMPFTPEGRPVILYERHIAWRESGRQHGASHPAVFNQTPGGYGAPGDRQYDRLRVAMGIDRRAALRACSWGKFQIMGFHAEKLGWPSVDHFVADMCESEEKHLDAFVAYNREFGLLPAMRRRDAKAYAIAYNGPNYKINRYDEKIAAAAARFRSEMDGADDGAFGVMDPVDTVRELQGALWNMGFDPGPHDGIDGPMTRAALGDFYVRVGIRQPHVVNAAAFAAAQVAAATGITFDRTA